MMTTQNDDATRNQDLGALAYAVAAAEPEQAEERIVPLGAIVVIANPRKHYDATKMKELEDSIQAHGLIQSVVVREAKLADGSPGYELIAGTRRHRAWCSLAQRFPDDPRWKAIRVSIQNRHQGTKLKVVQAIENLRRSDLSVLEVCDAVAELKADGLAEQAIAEELGYSKRHVERLIAIQESPSWLRHFGDEVETDEPVLNADGVKVTDKDGRPQFTKKRLPGFLFSDLHELVALHAKLNAWDRKQQDANTAHRPRAEPETRRIAKKAALAHFTGDRLKELIRERLAEVTGAPRDGKDAVDPGTRPVSPFHATEKRITIDLAALKGPLSSEDLARIKPDLTAALQKLGFQTIKLS